PPAPSRVSDGSHRHQPASLRRTRLFRVYREIADPKEAGRPSNVAVKLIEECWTTQSRTTLYMVFELVQRGNVLEVPTEQPLSEAQARAYFRDTLLGLEYPSNLLLTKDGRDQDRRLRSQQRIPRRAYLFLSGHRWQVPAFPSARVRPGGPAAKADSAAGPPTSGLLGVTLYCFLYGRVRALRQGAAAAGAVTTAFWPDQTPISAEAVHLMRRAMDKDPRETRITLPEIKSHPCVRKVRRTEFGWRGLPMERDNCRGAGLASPSEEVDACVRRVAKLETLILVEEHPPKHRSFKHPFLRNLSRCRPFIRPPRDSASVSRR
uniref:Protein kinase domain-containing protein n=1 Tax=Macrostomum lignano TaxID=282301 RepID=A0A1I8FRL5_9PLAT